MGKRAVILQSGYIPWLGFFSLINKADVFVFLDDVQWTRQDWRNRNRIRAGEGWKWLTVPVKLERHYWEYKICEVEIDYSTDWVSSHLGSLKASYGRTPFFGEVMQTIAPTYERKWDRISPLNYDLITRVCQYLGLSTVFVCSQNLDLPPELRKGDRLLAIINRIGDIGRYLTGFKARDYMDEEKFAANGIEVEWHNYHHPYYTQKGHTSFMSHLSVLDLLFNHGRESRGILTGETVVKKPEEITVMTPLEGDRHGERDKRKS